MNILIVDDYAINRRLLRAMLEAEGLGVLEAADGVEALAVLKREKIDAVISDILMPGMDGYRLCFELRQSQEFCGIPFIVYTSTYTSPSDERAALDLGADGFLKKPSPANEIIKALHQAIDNAPRLQRKATRPGQELALVREYNRRLVEKLEKKNVELERRTRELQGAHAKLHHLLAHSPAVMYTLKLEGQNFTPQVVSENINALLGRTIEESLRPGWWLENLHPEDRNRVLAAFSDAWERGAGTMEYRIRHKDGSYRWIEDKNRVVSDASGRPGEIVGVWTDITERKRAAQRLATHHAATQALAESATLGEASKTILQVVCQYLQWDVGLLWAVDATAKALRCVEVWHQPSEKFKDFATRSRETVFPAGEGLFGRVWEAGQPAWIVDVAAEPNFLRKHLATRMGLRSAVVVPMKLRAEALGVIEFFSAQTHPPDDALLAMFATVSSQIGQFIARKQLEDQLRQSQKMEAFGQLAGGVAHDFNNILAVILGYTSLLMNDENLSDGARAQLKQVYSAGERAAGLTRQMLTFGRKKQMQVTLLDLNGVIGNMTKMLGRIIGEDIDLQYNYSSQPPIVEADEGMIEQVLMNLVVNARDAMPKGGQLTIGTEAMAVDAARAECRPDARAGDFVCLSVHDTGCGIAPENMTRIFEPFFTTKGVGKGTGLGLATVYGIAKQHQGWIEVESQAGVGTSFKVFLPRSPRTAAALEQTSADPTVLGGNETILLVEDELAVRALARVVLQRHGYRVVEAGSGLEALSVWEEHGSPIDLLLTDMIMPDGMTGLDLAKQLLSRNPRLKVIYTSGYSADSEGTPSELRQAPTFLQKPYHPQKLARAVRECLDAQPKIKQDSSHK